MLNKPEDLRPLKRRFQAMVLVAGLVFMVLVARLVQLQILEGERFARRAERNYIQTIDVEAPRGRMYDAKERPLAVNRPAYTMYVTGRPKKEVPDGPAGDGFTLKRLPITDDEIAELASLIDFVDTEDRLEFIAKLEEIRGEDDGIYAQPVRSNLSNEEYARIETRGHLASWVEIRKRARRVYPHGVLMAFITGYMREITAEELEDKVQSGYRAGDRVGRTGLERQWENYLRGRSGEESRVVNNRGAVVKDPPPAAIAALPEPVEPIPGQDMYLSIDLDLQRVAAEAFGAVDFNEVSDPEYGGKRSGGLVAMEAKTGRILAMVSVPAIDPNLWEEPITAAQYKGWLESPFRPFIDKSVQEIFFPGSTYKVVSALAMLDDEEYDPDDIIECGRFVEYGGRKFRDTHACGPVNLEGAIIQSCNVYFYRLAMEYGLTLSKMETMARQLGLGQRTGLGINSEAAGVVPNEASEIRQGSFQQGVRLNSAIGQGNVKSTVLQVAVVYAAIANGGYVVTPSLVDKILTFDGKVVFETTPQYRNEEPVVSDRDRDRIHAGLIGVVNQEHGTAYSERLDSVTVAGKTGTAQVGRLRRGDEEEMIVGWDTTQDHAWFAAYAPAEDPELVVVALVEHGGTGADAAAPIVMKVIDYYLGGRSSTGETQEVNQARRAPGVPPSLPGADEEDAS